MAYFGANREQLAVRFIDLPLASALPTGYSTIWIIFLKPSFRHVLAGLNLSGADFNSQRLAVRAEYMDVFFNPVT
jgi:hypothetical protein